VGTIPPFSELIATTERSAVHLEMRDWYTPSDPVFAAWRGGRPIPDPAYPRWYDLVREHTARGVRFRRGRIVSEPLSAFETFIHAITANLNVAAGERVRWLPRRHASDLCLPGNDFWVFDDKLVRFHHFSGDGDITEDELADDTEVVKLCVSAFEAMWERGIEHEDYRPA
jgi:hypothetical protein